MRVASLIRARRAIMANLPQLERLKMQKAPHLGDGLPK
jgi:hypothetical protein